jgi:hypothetical protein
MKTSMRFDLVDLRLFLSVVEASANQFYAGKQQFCEKVELKC